MTKVAGLCLPGLLCTFIHINVLQLCINVGKWARFLVFFSQNPSEPVFHKEVVDKYYAPLTDVTQLIADTLLHQFGP